MKYLYYLLSLSVLIAFSSCSSSRYNTQNKNSQDYSQQPVDITYQQFYDDLSPYGNWVDYDNYGYAWVPAVPDFRPYYTNGYWVYTDYGWTWASNYSWGWAPFHYGRWINDMSYGWMWVPGYEWAPAWVSWRGGGDYYGWAPLGPGMSVNISVGSIPQNNWAFVPRQYINNPRINNYYVDRSSNVTIVNNTTFINNTTIVNNNGTRNSSSSYNTGPSVTEVERATKVKIRKVSVVGSDKPGSAQISNNTIRVFRPTVKQEPSNSGNTRPARVTNTQEIPGRNNTNNNPSSTPVRELPVNQRPEVNKNEPPVRNNPPTVSPNRNNEPVKALPNNNIQNQPTSGNRNQPPVNNTPANAPQRNIEGQNNIPQQNNSPVNNPVNQVQPIRKFDNSQNLPTNNFNKNSNTKNPNTIQRKVPKQKPIVQNNAAIHQPNQRMAKESNQVVKKPEVEKKDKEKE